MAENGHGFIHGDEKKGIFHTYRCIYICIYATMVFYSFNYCVIYFCFIIMDQVYATQATDLNIYIYIYIYIYVCVCVCACVCLSVCFHSYIFRTLYCLSEDKQKISLFKSFSQETTFHGLKQIYEEENTIVRR